MGEWAFEGSRWWKFDFHAHTPNSTDYGRGDEALKKRTPREWLFDHMAKGLDCVAVTDHNGGGWIDQLKREYALLEAERPEGFRELAIFPGVEITTNGNVHLLAILDPTRTTSDIDKLLGVCGYEGKNGESKSSTSRSFLEVAEAVVKFGGVAIPAHADQAAGLFIQIVDGNTLPAILTNPLLYSMEIVDKTYHFPELYASNKTKWTKIAGSDSHVPAEAGRRYTWIKMGRPCLEGLKLALMDGELSARRWDEVEGDPNAIADFVIKSISVSDGQYCGHGTPLSLGFSPWLSCIIGGRGSGKSTVLEMLRIGMRRGAFLREQLGEGSEVVAAFESFARVPEERRDRGALAVNTAMSIECLLNGENYRIQWTDDGGLPPIERELEDGSWAVSEGEVLTRFPISIYSQKQIYEMATKPEALLSIIDVAPEVGYREWAAENERLRSQYRSLKAQAREIELRVGEEAKLRGELEDVLVKLRLFEKGENARLLKEYQRRRTQAREIEAFTESLSECSSSLSTAKLEVVSLNIESFEGAAADEAVLKSISVFTTKVEILNKRLAEIQAEAGRFAEDCQAAITESAWQKRYKQTSLDYEALVQSLSAAGVGNPNEYGLFVQKKQQLERRLAEIEGLKTRVAELSSQAAKQLTIIDAHSHKLSESRRKFLAHALADNAVVRMELIERGQDIAFLESDFRSFIGREDMAFKDDILSDAHTQGILSPLAKEYQETVFSDIKRTLLDLHVGTNIKSFGKRFSDFIAKLSPEALDSLELWIPQDSVAVSYNRSGKSKSSFAPIEQGSPGQKTAAILAFILSHGHEPIILDQPEDDLDNHLIYNLVVDQMRDKKGRRQMIVVTHNPNIVVNGDAEHILAMESRNGQAVVDVHGCLQEFKVRRSICDIMEGGRDALVERYRRINIGDEYV